MTTRTTGRLAGSALLLYIAAGISEMVVAGSLNSGEPTIARLAKLARHAPALRFVIVLLFVEMACALVLAVTFYALTRDVDRDLAMLGMAFRFAEGTVGAVPVMRNLGLLSLATATASAAPGAEAAAALLFRAGGWSFAVGSTLFSIGSALFAALFLRGRLIPTSLAWTGLLGSLLMIVVTPLQAFRMIPSAVVWIAWMPLFVFEVTLATWLLVRTPTAEAATAICRS